MVFGRLKTGLLLTKDSLLLMRHNPKLGLFPLVSGAAGFLFLAIFLGVTFGLTAVAPEGIALAALFFVYLGLTFISSFFTAGLVHQTREVLEGGEASLRAGMAGAWNVKKPLLVWAFISATVGIIINAIENSDSRMARIFGVIFGVAWTLMTFFIIPVIVFEKTSTKGMFTRSASTFKQTWGETPISLIGVQLVSVAVMAVFALPAIYLFSVGIISIAIGLVLTGVLLSFLAAQTLQGVVKTVLYLYAATGAKPGEFNDIDFDDLASSKSRSSLTGPATSFQ